MTDDMTIGAVPLYTHTDRIGRGLAALGIGPDDAIPPEALYPLDQWHYHGAAAVRAAATQLRLGTSHRVLEIGSGIGGPARCLAHSVGCQVTALELQPELNSLATDLTRRAGLAANVTHRCGDALHTPLPQAEFDAVVSWLAILHIPDRPRLCARMASALRPAGQLYIEDLSMRAPFAPADLRELHEIVFGVSVTPVDGYVADLEAAGFTDVIATDMTEDWAPFVADRLRAWRADRDQHVQTQGEGAFVAQERFYQAIAHLFEAGSLGGVRITARR